VRDSCRKEGPQALISVCGGSGRAVDASSKLVTVFDALGSGRLRSVEEGWYLVDFIYYLFFRACGPGPGDRCLGVVIRGLLEGLLWSDVDIGVEELSLGPEPTMGATGFQYADRGSRCSWFRGAGTVLHYVYTDVDKSTKLWSFWTLEKSPLSVVQEKSSHHLSGGEI
jgi:hypothetical protein